MQKVNNRNMDDDAQDIENVLDINYSSFEEIDGALIDIHF